MTSQMNSGKHADKNKCMYVTDNFLNFLNYLLIVQPNIGRLSGSQEDDGDDVDG